MFFRYLLHLIRLKMDIFPIFFGNDIQLDLLQKCHSEFTAFDLIKMQISVQQGLTTKHWAEIYILPVGKSHIRSE